MLSKYLALMRVAWGISMEYRAQMLIWMLGSLLIIIMMLVWLSISRNGPVGSYTANDFVTYYLVGLFVRQITAVWSSWELDSQIREGRLSPLLLRPLHPIHNEIAANWTEKIPRIVILVPLITLFLQLLPHTPINFAPLNIVAFFVSLLGAWLLCFLLDYLVGMLAFWTSQALAFVQIVFALRMVFSGVLIPTELLPDQMNVVLQWLPFRYMLSFSGEIALGRIQYAELLLCLGIQYTWVLLFGLLVGLVWRRAMRSYSAVGA
jgi:ABC-2 type transport system permease protein